MHRPTMHYRIALKESRKMAKKLTTAEAIDAWGALKFMIANLEKQIEPLREMLADMPEGEYNGKQYCLSVSEFPITVYDNKAIRALLPEKVLRKHTSKVEQRRMAIKERN